MSAIDWIGLWAAVQVIGAAIGGILFVIFVLFLLTVLLKN